MRKRKEKTEAPENILKVQREEDFSQPSTSRKSSVSAKKKLASQDCSHVHEEPIIEYWSKCDECWAWRHEACTS